MNQAYSFADDQQHSSALYDCIIIGAGISGIAAAIKLNKVGYHNYKILEKADRVGGTWRENTYPGCGCDVPSALYSYSFAPSHQWQYLFGKQPEIFQYLENVSRTFNVEEKIDFNNGLIEAKWHEQAHYWELTTDKGTEFCRSVIFATGPITEAQTPKLVGIETFTGEMFHSAKWRHDLDLTGKRIAVIGTGASAIQFIPEIQPQASQLYIFQRTAPWVLPKPDLKLNPSAQNTLARLPIIQRTWRSAVSQSLNVINFGLRHPKCLKPVNVLAKQLLKTQVQNPSLRQAVTPNFDIGCKRLLFSNNYYPALQASNTQLIAQGLVGVDGEHVISADGQRFAVDVIIWGTGFEVSHPPIGKRVLDAKGQKLSERWYNSSPEAFLGTAITDVPNAFLVLGPNVLVYDSFIGLAEAQLDYIIDGLLKMKEKGITRLSIKPKVVEEHNRKVQQQVQSTVFNSGGCKSYYLDENGRNFAAWPWSLKALKQQLASLDLKHYDTMRQPSPQKLKTSGAIHTNV